MTCSISNKMLKFVGFFISVNVGTSSNLLLSIHGTVPSNIVEGIGLVVSLCAIFICYGRQWFSEPTAAIAHTFAK